MYKRLSRLYSEKRISEYELTNAVYKNLITEKEYTNITNKQYIPPAVISTYTLDEAATILVQEVNKE